MKRRVYKNILFVIGVLAFVACSKVDFSESPAASNGATCSPSCPPGGNTYDYSYVTAVSQMDALFVVDNSASMYALQQQMGSKFPSFFTNIQNLDYHIAITNTDIAGAVSADDPTNPSRSNLDGYSYTQNGQLLAFPDGSSFLTNTSSNAENQFLNTIARPETSYCEAWIQQNCSYYGGCSDTTSLHAVCPGEQTRAIWAAKLAAQNNVGTGFIRGAAVPLNIVILSNSDERASGGTVAAYPMATNDLPSTLISAVSASFPGKQLKVHSIIVQPGDSGCWSQQGTSTAPKPYALFGFQGSYYNQLSQATGGVVSSVCASDYSPALASIATSSASDDGSRDLPCTPKGLVVTLTPAVAISSSVTSSSSGTPRLTFSSPLPSKTSVHLQFSCN